MDDDLTYLKAEERWTHLIGRFMLDFASIEDCIHRVDFPRFSRQLIMSEITKRKLNERHQIYRRV